MATNYPNFEKSLTKNLALYSNNNRYIQELSDSFIQFGLARPASLHCLFATSAVLKLTLFLLTMESN